jgi:small neutral amino acid transporter SnatA (MarC family)
LHGTKALAELRGSAPEQLAGSIAMPILIGPGTVSAAVIVGNELATPWALGAIWSAMALVIAGLVALKATHDAVAPRNEALVRRYVDITGRVGALIVGSFGIEMIMVGVAGWIAPLLDHAGIG